MTALSFVPSATQKFTRTGWTRLRQFCLNACTVVTNDAAVISKS